MFFVSETDTAYVGTPSYLFTNANFISEKINVQYSKCIHNILYYATIDTMIIITIM